MLLLVFYWVHRRDISPVALLALPGYDAATAGYLWWAIVIPAGYMTIGLFLVTFTTKEGFDWPGYTPGSTTGRVGGRTSAFGRTTISPD